LKESRFKSWISRFSTFSVWIYLSTRKEKKLYPTKMPIFYCFLDYNYYFFGKKTSLLVFILHLSLVVEWWWHRSLVMNSLNLVLMNLDFVDIALCQGSLACYYCCWLLCTHFSLLGFFPLGFLGKVFNGIETEFSRSCGLGFGLIPQSAL
jgi:hypothetical protein